MEPLILGSTATWKFLAKLTDCEPSFIVWGSDHGVSFKYVKYTKTCRGNSVSQSTKDNGAEMLVQKQGRYKIFSGASSIIVLSNSNTWSNVLVLND